MVSSAAVGTFSRRQRYNPGTKQRCRNSRPRARPAAGGNVIDRNDPRWTRLRELIEQYSIKVGDFILSSGRTSKYLFQLRQTMLLPEGEKIFNDNQ
jgi:hypothetical protein